MSTEPQTDLKAALDRAYAAARELKSALASVKPVTTQLLPPPDLRPNLEMPRP